MSTRRGARDGESGCSVNHTSVGALRHVSVAQCWIAWNPHPRGGLWTRLARPQPSARPDYLSTWVCAPAATSRAVAA